MALCCGYPAISFPSVTQVLPSAIFRALWCKKKTRYLIETAGFILVAGASNQHYLRSREGRGVEAAGLADLTSRIDRTAGVSNRINLLFRTEVS